MSKVLTDTLIKLHNDPVLFVEEILGATPQPWQAKALRAVVKNDKISIRSGHGVGKSAYLSWLILWFLLTRYPAKIACTANTGSQLSDVLWGEVSKWARKMPDGFLQLLEIKSDKIELTGAPDSAAYARTAARDRPEALQGFHSPNMLFLVDEASGVPDIIFQVAEGALSTTGAKVVMCGNPTRNSGYFYDAFHSMSHRWDTMKVSCHDSTLVSPDFIRDMSEKYGEESNIFSIRVLGEFAKEDDDVLIPLHLIEDAVKRDVDLTETAPIVWGLDVARFGNDKTALAKRRGNHLLEPVLHWSGKDLMETTGILLTQYEDCRFLDRPQEIVVDSIGMGSAVVDRGIELDLPVIPCAVSESPSLRAKYVRLRDELWFKAREWFTGLDVRMPDDSQLIKELSVPRFSYTSTGKLKVESKDEMKKRLGANASPDLADAFCLTFAGQAVAAHHGRAYFTHNKEMEYGDSAWIV